MAERERLGAKDFAIVRLEQLYPLSPDIEKIPVSEFVDGMLAGLAEDQLEIYVPAFFHDIAKGKAQNDKRETEKKRDWEREKGRLMRHKVSGPSPSKD